VGQQACAVVVSSDEGGSQASLVHFWSTSQMLSVLSGLSVALVPPTQPDIENVVVAILPHDGAALPELVPVLVHAFLVLVVGLDSDDAGLGCRLQFFRLGDAVVVHVAPEQETRERSIPRIDHLVALTLAVRRRLDKLPNDLESASGIACAARLIVDETRVPPHVGGVSDCRARRYPFVWALAEITAAHITSAIVIETLRVTLFQVYDIAASPAGRLDCRCSRALATNVARLRYSARDPIIRNTKVVWLLANGRFSVPRQPLPPNTQSS
jgi:hypothetical protein